MDVDRRFDSSLAGKGFLESVESVLGDWREGDLCFRECLG